MSEYVIDIPICDFSLSNRRKKLEAKISEAQTKDTAETGVLLLAFYLMVKSVKFRFVIKRELNKMRYCINGKTTNGSFYNVGKYVDSISGEGESLINAKRNYESSREILFNLEKLREDLVELIEERNCLRIDAFLSKISLHFIDKSLDYLDEIYSVATDIYSLLNYKLNERDEALEEDIASLTRELTSKPCCSVAPPH